MSLLRSGHAMARFGTFSNILLTACEFYKIGFVDLDSAQRAMLSLPPAEHGSTTTACPLRTRCDHVRWFRLPLCFPSVLLGQRRGGRAEWFCFCRPGTQSTRAIFSPRRHVVYPGRCP